MPHPRRTAKTIRRQRSGFVPCVAVVSAAILLASCGSSDAGSEGTTAETPNVAAPSDLAQVSGTGSASMPPWPVPKDAQQRAELAGLPMGPMGMAEHYHPVVRITVDGEAMEVPPNIGVDPVTGQMSAVHTHTPDGVIHIEASTKGETFTLGQLFTEWDVKPDRNQMGALGADGSGAWKVTVDGEPYRGDPALLVLKPDQRIVLDFTSAS